MALLVRFVPLALLVACGLSPESGQYRCDDSERCPADMFCVNNVCQSERSADSGPLDSGVDTGPFDSGSVSDAGLFDSGPALDVGPDSGAEESCSRDVQGWAHDEDMDGTIDEGCAWSFGRVHVVPGVHTSPLHFGVAFGGDGETAYLATGRDGDPIQTRARSSAASVIFGPVQDVANTSNGSRADLVSVSADEQVLVSQTGIVPQLNIFRRIDGAFATPATIFGGYHPWLSDDGRELFLVLGLAPRIERYAVNAEGTFGMAELVERGALFPSLIPGGRYLLFVERGGVFFRRRDDPGEDFGAAVRLDESLDGFYRPVYLPRSSEMWFAGDIDRSQRRIYRVQVCRDGDCDEEPQVDCDEANAVRSADGFHCYWVPEVGAVPLMVMADEAAALCGDDGHLATIVGPDEAAAVESLGGNAGGAWLGLVREDCGEPDCGMTWRTGEPELWSDWGSGQPEANNTMECGFWRAEGWSSGLCNIERRTICERETYPTWITP